MFCNTLSHYHSMEEFALYDIYDADGNLAAEGHKASYCLRDTTCFRNYRPAYNCDGKNDQGLKSYGLSHYMKYDDGII